MALNRTQVAERIEKANELHKEHGKDKQEEKYVNEFCINNTGSGLSLSHPSII